MAIKGTFSLALKGGAVAAAFVALMISSASTASAAPYPPVPHIPPIHIGPIIFPPIIVAPGHNPGHPPVVVPAHPVAPARPASVTIRPGGYPVQSRTGQSIIEQPSDWTSGLIVLAAAAGVTVAGRKVVRARCT